jgi:hypothetical protein
MVGQANHVAEDAAADIGLTVSKLNFPGPGRVRKRLWPLVRSLRRQVSGQKNDTQEGDRMPRDAAIILGDLIGKLDGLRVLAISAGVIAVMD